MHLQLQCNNQTILAHLKVQQVLNLWPTLSHATWEFEVPKLPARPPNLLRLSQLFNFPGPIVGHLSGKVGHEITEFWITLQSMERVLRTVRSLFTGDGCHLFPIEQYSLGHRLTQDVTIDLGIQGPLFQPLPMGLLQTCQHLLELHVGNVGDQKPGSRPLGPNPVVNRT